MLAKMGLADAGQQTQHYGGRQCEQTQGRAWPAYINNVDVVWAA